MALVTVQLIGTRAHEAQKNWEEDETVVDPECDDQEEHLERKIKAL